MVQAFCHSEQDSSDPPMSVMERELCYTLFATHEKDLLLQVCVKSSEV